MFIDVGEQRSAGAWSPELPRASDGRLVLASPGGGAVNMPAVFLLCWRCCGVCVTMEPLGESPLSLVLPSISESPLGSTTPSSVVTLLPEKLTSPSRVVPL